MKKTLLNTVALTVFAIMLLQSCDSSSSKLDKFMGEWKRIDNAEKDNPIVKKQDGAILIIVGKDTVVARYDKHSNTLKFWAMSNTVITYNPKSDHLLINNGKDGEAKRVK